MPFSHAVRVAATGLARRAPRRFPRLENALNHAARTSRASISASSLHRGSHAPETNDTIYSSISTPVLKNVDAPPHGSSSSSGQESTTSDRHTVSRAGDSGGLELDEQSSAKVALKGDAAVHVKASAKFSTRHRKGQPQNSQRQPASMAPQHPWAASRMPGNTSREKRELRAALMEKLGTARIRADSSAAERVLAEAIESPGIVDLSMLNASLNASVQGGDWRATIRLKDKMKSMGFSPNEVTYTSLITACGNGGEWKRAIRFLTEMPSMGVEPNVIHYNATITACGKSRRSKEAIEFLRKITVVGLEPSEACYCSAITACGRDRQPKLALALLQEMKTVGIQPSTRAYLQAIRACRTMFLGSEAIAILGQMSAAGLPIDLACYSAAISANSRVSVIRNLLEELKAAKVKPNVMVYESCIMACGQQKDWKTAVALLREMSAIGLKPTIITYTCTIAAVGKVRQSGAALSLLRESTAAGILPDIKCYNACIKAAGTSRKSGLAINLLREMPTVGLTPNVISYSEAIMACARSQNGIAGLSLFDELQAAGIAPDFECYIGAIKSCGSDNTSHLWRRALELLHDMKNNVPKNKTFTKAYTVAIIACGNALQSEQAVLLLREMLSSCTMNKVDATEAYTAAIQACGKVGDWEKSVALMREFPPPKPFSMYRACVEACVKAQAQDQALKLLQEMKDEGFYIDRATYNFALLACQQWDQCMNLLREMRDLNFVPSLMTYDNILKVEFGPERLEETKKMLMGMSSPSCPPSPSPEIPDGPLP